MPLSAVRSYVLFDMYRLPRILCRLWQRTERLSRWLVYFLLICVSDAWDSVFWSSPYVKKLEDNPSESDQWNDAEVMKRYWETPGMKESATMFGSCPVRRICHDVVVKPCSVQDRNKPASEVFALNMVRSDTDILTPRVRRTIDVNRRVYMVMEHIEGTQLALCWNSLSFWTQLRIARILRQYIKQLQKIRHSHSHIPGPISASPRHCDGYQFGDRWGGPFPDYASLSEHYNKQLRRAQSRGQIDAETEPFDDSKPLVFTHNDLNMRNILLGMDGRVWLVDWAWSGFYPQWFEYQAMISAARQDEAPRSWKWLIPFIASPYFRQQQWMLQIGYI